MERPFVNRIYENIGLRAILLTKELLHFSIIIFSRLKMHSERIPRSDSTELAKVLLRD